ncbi:MAG TPA: aminotransferase class V-fold PLP-dependent enzyme [Pyrinomonadaceae bacterium]|nr:aminotransferase class V-fold PLP-dependent enzyme [Pyrinomonadaceae bacterium]
MTIDRHREEFPTLASGIHLLSHSLGPVPRVARESMIDYIDAWEHHTSEDAWATSWWELSRRVGDRIARILGGAAGSVQIQPNASLALATVASCFDFKTGRNKVVTTALDFPSMEYFWDAQRHIGARVEVVPSADGISVPLERILETIDSETCLVALAHTSYRSSYRVDAQAIVKRAHEKGALVLLDVYQSAGVLQLSAADWNVDFLIGGTIKWLCGGPSCGYLYVRPDLQRDLRPRLTGWVAHDSPFDFAHAPMRYAKSVRRFAQGTPSIPALYSAMPGLEIIEAVAIEAIAAESKRRTQLMIDFAGERGWTINTPLEQSQRGGSVMIGVEDAPSVVERLAERRVFVDWRPSAGLRISPHFFNTDEEVEEALQILASLIDPRSSAFIRG